VRKHHVAVYGDKAVPMNYLDTGADAEFRFAGMRIVDNATSGFIVCPDGRVFEVSRSNRKARLVGGELALAAIAKAEGGGE